MQFFKAEARGFQAVFHSGSSKEAFDLIDHMSAKELTKPYQLKIPNSCILEQSVNKTVGIQCLIELFDPLDGWGRNYKKRPDILKMTAKLIQKEVCIEGIYFYDRTIKEYIQILINKGPHGADDPPADLSQEVVKTFIEHGYQFSYTDEEHANYAAELTAQIIATIEDKTKLPKPLLKIVASYYTHGILHTRFFDSQRRADNLSNASAEASITKAKP